VSQKTNVNDRAETVKKNLSHKVKVTLRSFLMRFANALMLPTGQASQDKTRPGGAQPLLAREQLDTSAQDSKHKSPEKAKEDWHIRHDKKVNYILFFMGQMAKAKNAQENSSHTTTGNSRGGGRGGGRGERGGPRVPFNNRQGQDDLKENIKQQASLAAAQQSKRGKKSGNDSASTRRELWTMSTRNMRTGPRNVRGTSGWELRLESRSSMTMRTKESEGTNLYGKTAGDLDQDDERRRTEQAHQKSYDRFMSGWSHKDLINHSEDDLIDDKPKLINSESNGGTYEVSPTKEAGARRRVGAIWIS
jgi:hypothetical protein